MRCLYGKDDDLHEYAERVLKMPLGGLLSEFSMSKDYGPFTSIVLHRDGRFQTEMVIIEPNTMITDHTHPGVDSIECTLLGGVRLHVSGHGPSNTADDKAVFDSMRGKLVRISGSAKHGGLVGKDGVTFLSMQRWNDIPIGYIGIQWSGLPVSSIHRDLLG